MCTHYEADFKDLLKGWGVPYHEWKNYADVYRDWKKTRDAETRAKAENQGKAPHTGIEPNQASLVIQSDGTVAEMRWGYMRRRERADGKGMKEPAPTGNARSEKVAHPRSMWFESWKAGRRCIIPVSAFYEWTYPMGRMVVHRFHMGGLPFGIAGLWEPSDEFGPCFTMLTTIPNREVAATGHDRCLVALKDEEEAARWFGGADFKREDFLRPDGLLLVESGVPNPRASSGAKSTKNATKTKFPPAQGELF